MGSYKEDHWYLPIFLLFVSYPGLQKVSIYYNPSMYKIECLVVLLDSDVCILYTWVSFWVIFPTYWDPCVCWRYMIWVGSYQKAHQNPHVLLGFSWVALAYRGGAIYCYPGIYQYGNSNALLEMIFVFWLRELSIISASLPIRNHMFEGMIKIYMGIYWEAHQDPYVLLGFLLVSLAYRGFIPIRIQFYTSVSIASLYVCIWNMLASYCIRKQ